MPSPACTEKQAKFLRKLGGDPAGLNVSQAAAEIDRLLGKEPQRGGGGGQKAYTGKKPGPGPISDAQKKVLTKYKVDTIGMTKVQASARIDEIAANGWKVPEYNDEPEGFDDGIPFGN